MNRSLNKGLTGLSTLLGGLTIGLFIMVLPPIGKHYRMPSMSMAPNILSDDIIYASNLSYTVSKHKVPERGDIITFKPEGNSKIFVKRVIGLPGDQVQIREGRLFINDKLIERRSQSEVSLRLRPSQPASKVTLYGEHLTTGTKSIPIFEMSDREKLDNTALFNVPKGYVFTLGDNRDHSYDSRVSTHRGGAGFIPIDNIIGKVKYVLVPSKSCKNIENLFCPKRKNFQKL